MEMSFGNLATSTTVTNGPISSPPSSDESASVSRSSAGCATRVASTMTRCTCALSRSSSTASISEPRNVQHRHPELSSTTSIFLPRRMSPSTPTSPNSFTMTAVFIALPRSARRCFARVVLPEPRKPKRRLTRIASILPQRRRRGPPGGVALLGAERGSRKVHAVDEDRLEFGARRQGDVLDALREIEGAQPLGFREECHLGADGGGVAHVGDALQRELGKEPDLHRALDADVVAKTAAQHQLRDVVARDSHDVAQHQDPGVDGALRELELANVGLGDADVMVAAGVVTPDQHELAAALAVHDALLQRGTQRHASLTAQQAVGVDHARIEHLRARVDQARAANA